MTLLEKIKGILSPDSGHTEKQDNQKEVKDTSYIRRTWENTLTGLGGADDRGTYHTPNGVISILDNRILNQLFIQDPIARRICDQLPKDAFRRGFGITYKGTSKKDESLVQLAEEEARRLSLKRRAFEQAVFSRVFGGGGLIINIPSPDLLKELSFEKKGIPRISSLRSIDARYLLPKESSYDPYSERANLRFADHEYYKVAFSRSYGTEMNSMFEIHASRIAVFGGSMTNSVDRWSYFKGWDASILQPVYDTLQIFQQDNQTKSAMLQDASIGVLKIFQMFEQISGKRLSQLNERLNLAHQSRWVGKTIPIDTREDYSRISHAFTGIPELLEADQYLVAAAACMPITKLFGRSPAGENATGEHDEANWTAIVESAQEEDYSEPIIKIVKLIAASIGAQDLENWGIKWHPTESHTSKQRLEIEKIVAETDLLRVNLGIEESAMVSWRFGQGEYRSDPPVFSEEEIRSWDSDIPDTEEDPDLPDLDKEEEEEEEEEEEDQNKESN